jgi:hypothetical protein
MRPSRTAVPMFSRRAHTWAGGGAAPAQLCPAPGLRWSYGESGAYAQRRRRTANERATLLAAAGRARAPPGGRPSAASAGRAHTAACLGFGRIVVSETEVPIPFVNLV